MRFSGDQRDIFQRYRDKIANRNNIFRIIGDVIEESISETGSECYIEEQNVTLLFYNKSRIDELVKRAVPKTEGEKNLLIWKKENARA